MSAKAAYKALHQQLLVNSKAAAKKQDAQELKKRIALLTYQRINAIQAKDTAKTTEIQSKLDELKKKITDPAVEVDPRLIAGVKISTESAHSVEHINDIANFLGYHRQYNVLIERYNPGLSMTQTDKIRKTANHVGFELPPDK